jgi:hypothetical protein
MNFARIIGKEKWHLAASRFVGLFFCVVDAGVFDGHPPLRDRQCDAVSNRRWCALTAS